MKKRMIYLMLAAGMSLSCLTGCAENEETEVAVSKNDEMNGQESEEIAPATDNETVTDKNHQDLNAEISATEEAFLEMQKQLQSSADESDKNSMSSQAYKLWDDELNSLWSRFSDSACGDLKSDVLEEQRTWVKNKENEIKLTGEQCEGSAIQPLMENTKAADLTRMRCYELAGYLAKATEQKFDLEVPKPKCLEFVDRQGTADTYSELIIEETAMNSYTVVMGIYRLTTFEGNAVMQDDGTYKFEDGDMEIKGIIRVSEDGLKAAFEITETNWSLVSVGDVFEFPERRSQESK